MVQPHDNSAWRIALAGLIAAFALPWSAPPIAIPIVDLAAPALRIPARPPPPATPPVHGPKPDALAAMAHRISASERVFLRADQVAALTSAVREAGARHDIDPRLLLAIAWRESRFRAHAIGDHGRSCGAFQIRTDLPGRPTCRRMMDLHHGADFAASYLDHLRRTCDPEHFIAAYNAGCRRRHLPNAQRYQRQVKALSAPPTIAATASP